MGLLDDDSLDDRAREIIKRKKRQKVAAELLQRAAMIEEGPSPAMLEGSARWLGVVDDLRAGGFTDAEVIRVSVRANKDLLGIAGPNEDTIGHLLAVPDGLALARQLADEVLAKTERPFALQRIANAALARLAAAGPIDARYDELFAFYPTERTPLRAIVAAIPAERRDAVIARQFAEPPAGGDGKRRAAFALDKLLDIEDLVMTPAICAVRDRALERARGDRDYDALAAEIASGKSRPAPSAIRPTRKAANALRYLGLEVEREGRAADILPLAQEIWPKRRLIVDARELGSVEAWIAAGRKRQRQIADAVAAATLRQTGVRAKVVKLASFGGPPIAVIAIGKQRFHLIPGGEVEVGFSEEEEAAVRASAEVNAGRGNHYEMYGALLDRVDILRPVTKVRVGPMLASPDPGVVFERDEATNVLADSRFRVPSEAEWEYLARGGVARELTYRGDVVPDTADEFRDRSRLGAAGANAFGLWGFGLDAELCADVFAESHDDLPTDGSPRLGDGERVVRGGAAQLFPWQDCGEWHLLLNAMRVSTAMWEFTIALRFVLGIEFRN